MTQIVDICKQPRETVRLPFAASQAVRVEKETGVPAQLNLVVSLIESKWISEAPANNCHGIKSLTGEPIITTEHLTPAQIEAERKRGIKILSLGKVFPSGKIEVKIRDSFKRFESLEKSFDGFADFIQFGSYMKPRWDRFLEHKDVDRLWAELGDSSLGPVYYTGEGYLSLKKQIEGQKNFKDALEKARG
jgi:hypothetical protein